MELWVDTDLLFLRAQGAMQRSEADEVLRYMQQMRAEHGAYFLLVDLRAAGGIPSQLRRYVVERAHSFLPAAAAAFGAPMIPRGVTALLIGAFNLFSKQRPNMRIFGSESEARDWMASERKRLSRRPQEA